MSPRPTALPGPLARGWMQFSERILPAGAPLIQKQETRRAFYAGAAWLFNELVSGFDDGTEPTDADMELMNVIHGEIDQWLTDLDQGRV